MKRKHREYNLELDSEADYKEEWIYDRDKENYESVTKWLYLAQDVTDLFYAKIGITMGDLTARSYSSANPNYRIFCAFKCKFNISQKHLRAIENSALLNLEEMYTNPSFRMPRMRHVESRRNSECFTGIHYLNVFRDLHHYLYENHRSDFVTCGLINDVGHCEGELIDLEFNPNLSRNKIRKYKEMIVEHEC